MVSASASSFDAPPYYPAPYGGWVDEWRDSYSKAKKLVDSMTLAEKTNITAGTGIFMGKSIKSGALKPGYIWIRRSDAAIHPIL